MFILVWGIKAACRVHFKSDSPEVMKDWISCTLTHPFKILLYKMPLPPEKSGQALSGEEAIP